MARGSKDAHIRIVGKPQSIHQATNNHNHTHQHIKRASAQSAN